jgi:hypothetical protein
MYDAPRQKPHSDKSRIRKGAPFQSPLFPKDPRP